MNTPERVLLALSGIPAAAVEEALGLLIDDVKDSMELAGIESSKVSEVIDYLTNYYLR
jgi:hypothetical protein